MSTKVYRFLEKIRDLAVGKGDAFDVVVELMKEANALLDEKKVAAYPGTEGAPTDAPGNSSRMIRISKLIADLTDVYKRFGDTCVYIRRRGLSWGAVAMNYEAEDEKRGVFCLQEEHDAAMMRCLERINWLVKENGDLRLNIARLSDEAADARSREARLSGYLREKDAAMGELFKRLHAAGVDCSDLIP